MFVALPIIAVATGAAWLLGGALDRGSLGSGDRLSQAPAALLATAAIVAIAAKVLLDVAQTRIAVDWWPLTVRRARRDIGMSLIAISLPAFLLGTGTALAVITAAIVANLIASAYAR